MNLVPKPSNGLSAFYSGTIDPRVLPVTVVGYSLYVDKIIMISPFPNPRAMNKEYSPYHSPSQYRDDTIKNVFLMFLIMPLIDAGIVEMIPDPSDFDPYFRQRIYKMAEARMNGRGISKEDMGYAEKLMQDDWKRFMFSLPPEVLARQIKKASPDLSEEELEKLVKYAQEEKFADPLAPLQPLTPGEDGGQLRIFRMGGNLETALYLAQVTGSYVYTDVKYRWREIQSTVLKRPGEDDFDPWGPVVQALDDIEFRMYVHPDPAFLQQAKENGVFREFIALYRRICTSARNIKDPEEASVEARELAYIIKNLDIKPMSDMIEKDYDKMVNKNGERAGQYKVKVPVSHLIPAHGFSTNTIVQILLTHGSDTPYWEAVPFGAFLDMEKIEPIHEN
jgi:hypothetical protein